MFPGTKKPAKDKAAPAISTIPAEKKAGAANKPLVSGSQKVSGRNIFGGAAPVSATQTTPPEMAGPDKDQMQKQATEAAKKKISGRMVFGVGGRQ